jgi:hypothetical protein
VVFLVSNPNLNSNRNLNFNLNLNPHPKRNSALTMVPTQALTLTRLMSAHRWLLWLQATQLTLTPTLTVILTGCRWMLGQRVTHHELCRCTDGVTQQATDGYSDNVFREATVELVCDARCPPYKPAAPSKQVRKAAVELVYDKRSFISYFCWGEMPPQHAYDPKHASRPSLL